MSVECLNLFSFFNYIPDFFSDLFNFIFTEIRSSWLNHLQVCLLCKLWICELRLPEGNSLNYLLLFISLKQQSSIQDNYLAQTVYNIDKWQYRTFQKSGCPKTPRSTSIMLATQTTYNLLFIVLGLLLYILTQRTLPFVNSPHSGLNFFMITTGWIVHRVGATRPVGESTSRGELTKRRNVQLPHH